MPNSMLGKPSLRGIVIKTFQLLDPGEQRKTILICGAVVLSALCEVLSVALILPFMSVLFSSQEPGGLSTYLSNLMLAYLGPTSMHHQVLWVGGLCIGFIIGNSAISLLVRHALIRYCYGRYHQLSRRLFAYFLASPYSFFLNKQPSLLAELIIVDCEAITSKIFLGLMVIFSNFAVCLGVGVMLLLVNPWMTVLTVLSIGGLYLIAYMLVHRRVLELGWLRQAASDQHTQIVQEALRGIKEVQVFLAEPYFMQRYEDASYVKTDTTGLAVALSEFPRKIIEVVAIGGAMAVMLYFADSKGRIDSIIPLLSLYVFSAYRLLPMVQQIFQQSVKVRFFAPVVEKVHHILYSATQPDGFEFLLDTHKYKPAHNDHFQKNLVFNAVDFYYDGENGRRHALSEVSLSIKAGQFVGIVGPSGAGKSTLTGLLLGLLIPTQGVIKVDTKPLWEINPKAWRAGIGYVPQHIILLDDSIAANIAFGDPEPDMARIQEVAHIACLHDFIAQRLPQGYLTRVGSEGLRLSGGEKQRIGIARALYADPNLLILDEATSSLDREMERVVLQRLMAWKSHRTIVAIAHNATALSACDYIYVLEQGRLASSGTLDEVFRNHCNEQQAHKEND